MTVQRVGGDSIYGTGSDGTVIINSNTSLSRDMYYENLTINSNINLNTNGFRIFVKNTLTINGNIQCNTNSNTGTVSGSDNLNTGNVTYVLGGNAGANAISGSKLTDGQKQDIMSLVDGIIADTSGSFVRIRGGVSGRTGENGVLTPAGLGSAGTLNVNPLVPGGPGTPGTNVPQSIGGTGGRGGGLVLICARIINGSGNVVTIGSNALSGGNSATGSAGQSAPSGLLNHLVDGTAEYRTGDGVTGPLASIPVPNLPHGGHVPQLISPVHGHVFRHVHRGPDHARHDSPGGHHCCHNYGEHPSGGNFSHTYGAYSIAPPTSNYFSINGINHTTPHRNHSGVAFTPPDSGHHGNGPFGHTGGTHGAHYGSFSDNPVGKYTHTPEYHAPGDKFIGPVHHGAYHSAFHYPRNHQDINTAHYRIRNAGTVSSQGSFNATGGTGGQAGSTTAAEHGIAGGGGGIIMIADFIAETVGTITTGGQTLYANGQPGFDAAESGSVVKIINI